MVVLSFYMTPRVMDGWVRVDGLESFGGRGVSR